MNRWLGRRLAALAHIAGLTPDVVTVLSFATTLVSLAILIVTPLGPPVAFVVSVVGLLSYALDSADGQLARLRGSGGPAGEWLDHVVDAARGPLIHLAILIHLVLHTDVPMALAAGLTLPYGFAISLRFFALILGEQLRRRAATSISRDDPREGAGGGAVLRSLVQLPADPATLYLFLLLLPWPRWFVVAYGVLLATNVVLTIASLVRRYTELRSS